MTDVVPFITLTKENFAVFQRQVYDYASSICLDNGFLTHRHGLLSFVVTTNIWQNLPGNQIPDDAVPPNIAFRPRDVLIPPEIPAENANAWRVFEYRTKEFDSVATAVLLLTRRLKDALPSSDRNELSDPILGMGQLTALDLMTHLRTQYGTLTSEDYKSLHAQLSHKLDSATNFTGFAADQRFIFQQLAAYGQPIPELQKCDFLRSGTCHLFPVQKAIDSYLTAHPHTANQTFHNFVAHNTLHSPNFSQSAGDMATLHQQPILLHFNPLTFLQRSQHSSILLPSSPLWPQQQRLQLHRLHLGPHARPGLAVVANAVNPNLPIHP